jgi:hypothetical protein
MLLIGSAVRGQGREVIRAASMLAFGSCNMRLLDRASIHFLAASGVSMRANGGVLGTFFTHGYSTHC